MRSARDVETSASESRNRHRRLATAVVTLLVTNLLTAGRSSSADEASLSVNPAVTTGSFRTIADTSDRNGELLRLQSADPAADVAVAIKKGDLRFLEVAGFSTEIPGIHKGPRLGWLMVRYGVRRIEGTTDDKMIPELQESAWRYAERYNKLLLEHIDR